MVLITRAVRAMSAVHHYPSGEIVKKKKNKGWLMYESERRLLNARRCSCGAVAAPGPGHED